MDHSRIIALLNCAKGFLTELSIENSMMPGVVLVTGSYDIAAYSDTLFDRIGIPFPKSLHRAVNKRKSDFLAGRAMSWAAMSTLGVSPTAIEIAPSRAPIWPAGVTGSISHAKGRCACLLSHDTGQTYGVDTEAFAKDRSLAAILSETLNTAELQSISQSPHPEAVSATLVFSAKEALFKALFPRVDRHFGFDAAELQGAPTGTNLTLALTTDLTPSLPAGTCFDIYYSLNDTHILTWLRASNS